MGHLNKNGIVYADDIEDACVLATALVEPQVSELERFVLNIDQHIVNLGAHRFDHPAIKILQANQKQVKRLILELNKTIEILKKP